MSRALYVVILSREQWWVDFEGQAHGPFASTDEAAEEARQLARYAAHMGRPSEVLAPDQHGRHRVVWSSDDEPHASADYTVTHAAE